VNNSIALVVDTNSNYSDVWAPCFGRLEKYASGVKKYAFTDSANGRTSIPEDVTPVTYDNSESYRNQFLSCLNQIEEEYIIYTSEDYILYDYAQLDAIEEVAGMLSETGYSFCKFIKGPENTQHYKDNLYIIDPNDANFFAQQAALWNTRDFEKIFETAPSTNTRMQHEPGGSAICRELGLQGFQYFSNTPRRGMMHYDSEIYPYIATAVVKGLWNLTEYPAEMAEVIKEFSIDCRERGWR